MLAALLFSVLFGTGVVLTSQLPLADVDHASSLVMSPNITDKVEATLSQQWDVIGPFPQSAREQHFLNPACPISLHSDIPIDYAATYPSSLADNAIVGWSTVDMLSDGLIQVEYPDIRWEMIRSTVGWAGLQHHSLLHGVVTVRTPYRAAASPSSNGTSDSRRCELHVKVEQGSFFTLVPRFLPRGGPIQWHTANIYGLRPSLPSILSLDFRPPSNNAMSHLMEPAYDEYVYDMYISADYEIRLFGDPLANRQSSIPLTSVRVQVSAHPLVDHVRILSDEEDGELVVPDFVNGWALGEAIGVRLKAGSEWAEVLDAKVEHVPGFKVTPLLSSFELAPTQTRSLPLNLTQTAPLLAKYSMLPLTISVRSASGVYTSLTTAVPLRHILFWGPDSNEDPLRMTHFVSQSPRMFLAKPPRSPSNIPNPPVLALHGAGVPLTLPFWPASIPRFDTSWTVFPLGGSEWGMDWHGVSSDDAWGAVDTLRTLINGGERKWTSGWDVAEKTILVGHSNGGQGAWWNALRWPDKVLAALPASAYLTPPTYVPITHSRSARFVDPALASILDAASLEERNDLYLSNIVGVSSAIEDESREGTEWVMVLHGGEDENVPVWHGREAASLVKACGAHVKFVEEAGMRHWWDGAFISAHAKAFFRHAFDRSFDEAKVVPDKFRLAVAQPEHQGSMFDWSVDELQQPGRLATLSVHRVPLDAETVLLEVETVNVEVFTVGRVGQWSTVVTMTVDGVRVDSAAVSEGITLRRSDRRAWQIQTSNTSAPVPNGPLTSVLRSQGPIVAIIPHERPCLLSAALRLAHTVLLYLRIDVRIMYDDDALALWEAGELVESNLIILGGAENGFGARLLEQRSTEFGLDEDGRWCLQKRVLEKPSTGIMFLHPHPISPSSVALFIAGSDEDGIERVLRLFPIRTGVPVPHWVVIGDHADWQAAGGIIGAGFWSNDWKWSETMSWLS